MGLGERIVKEIVYTTRTKYQKYRGVIFFFFDITHINSAYRTTLYQCHHLVKLYR